MMRARIEENYYGRER